jgi:hypothetical protein
MTRKVALLALLCFGCSNGSQGAVSFRWRILNQCTGETFDPANNADIATGACVSPGWRVDIVRLYAQRLDISANQLSFDFSCDGREGTTPFQIPAGEYSLSVAGLRPGGPGIQECTEATTPPPVVRSVKDAEITNIDVIQLNVSTCPYPCP